MQTYDAGRWGEALAPILPTLERASREGLREWAEQTMTESKRIVPYETGALQGSGHVEDVEQTGTLLSVTLGYGGPAAPYALFVHERLNLQHKPPTQAKYLERPVLERAALIAPTMAEAMARALAGLR